MAMEQKSLIPSLVIAVSFLIGIVTCNSDRVLAQQKLPVTVNVKSGHRFEGRLSAVNGYSTKNVPADSGASCFRVENGLQRVFISKHHLVNEEPVPLNIPEIEFSIWQDAIRNKGAYPRSQIGAFGFNEFGHRVIRVDTKHGPKNFVQGITKITPEYVQLSSLKTDGPKTSLTMSIGTGAVPVETIRKLLHNQITNGNSPVEYQEIFGYFLRAQQFDEALKELDLIERRFPERKDQVNQDRARVRQSRARQVVREINRRIESNQTDLAKELAGAHMNKEGVAQNTLIELQDILSNIDAADAKVIEVREKVSELVQQYQGAGKPTDQQKMMLQQFLAELNSELSPSNVARLDSYLVQANDAAQTDEQKVALAISGWLRGSNNAVANFATTESMFTVRDLIRAYLSDGDAAKRKEIIKRLKELESGTPEIVASMLAQMKPIEHDKAIAGYTGEKPIEFNVVVPGTTARPADQSFRVLVHLPIEYDPYRRYPLMITLPNIGVSADNQLDLFNEKYVPGVGRLGRASRRGVIVASVQWNKPGQAVAEYTAREHATVLGAMRACFRKFSVNTDRVFLHGHGRGANLVYDIGLAHPEHFAGLIPIGGIIEKYAKVHALNRDIPLSIYAVIGEGDVTTQAPNRMTWDKWLTSSKYGTYVNLILVEYVGRLGNESFLDDMESMFDWMEFQRRRLPDQTGFEFVINSLRKWDNRYWFMELHGFPVNNIMSPQTWDGGNLNKLRIEAELKPKEGDVNKFVLGPSKAGQGMTLWLAPEFVDFNDEIRISGRGKFRQGVTPSTRVILDDVRRRADRLHPYWARIDCFGSKWSVSR